METTQARTARGTADCRTRLRAQWEEQVAGIAARRARRIRDAEAQYAQELADLREVARLVDGIVTTAAAVRAGPDTPDIPGAAAG